MFGGLDGVIQFQLNHAQLQVNKFDSPLCLQRIGLTTSTSKWAKKKVLDL